MWKWNIKVSIGNYVLVKFATKRDIVYYVGLVVKKTDEDYVHISFMQKKLTGNQFTFPEAVDESPIDVKDIVMVLPDPNVSSGNSRMTLSNMSFNISFANFNIRWFHLFNFS